MPRDDAAAPAAALAAGSGRLAPGGWPAALQARWPGLLLCAVMVLAAGFIARAQGGPLLLYALLFGVSFHFLHDDPRIRPGLDWCGGTLLRVGVALLGARITWQQVAALGWGTVLAVAVGVASTIACGVWLARRLGFAAQHGVLSGGATAICGASAAMALAAVLPRSEQSERFTALVVVAVTALSTLAMVLYPLLAHALQLSAVEAGVFLGGSIHDVAQVIAAGYVMGPQAGDMAVIVKLLRVALLVAVVAAVAVAFRAQRAAAGGEGTRAGSALPWFLWVFAALVVLQSLHAVPLALQPVLGDASRACLAMAIAALGARMSFRMLWGTGWRALALLLAETLWLAGVLLCAIRLGHPI